MNQQMSNSQLQHMNLLEKNLELMFEIRHLNIFLSSFKRWGKKMNHGHKDLQKKFQLNELEIMNKKQQSSKFVEHFETDQVDLLRVLAHSMRILMVRTLKFNKRFSQNLEDLVLKMVWSLGCLVQLKIFFSHSLGLMEKQLQVESMQ